MTEGLKGICKGKGFEVYKHTRAKLTCGKEEGGKRKWPVGYRRCQPEGCLCDQAEAVVRL